MLTSSRLAPKLVLTAKNSLDFF